ncbi:MAG: hypothetical protein JXA37_09285 [Chloroflexia bacterium]|nr:hypothetical protein [Chloroflexia bacterium]
MLLGCGGGPADWIVFRADVGGYARMELPPGSEVPPAAPALEVDLDADGRPERAVLEGPQVRLEREGQVVWRSKPEWRVVDVAAGDVGDDLRQELLLAMWREDEGGVERSQPYIIGYRNGRYDLVWGGSPVSEPIYELDLGDVDGDGANELVVLTGLYGDAPGTPARYLTVLGWNGWGFTRLWRSEAGRYRQLRLLDTDGDGILDILLQAEVPSS